MKNYVLLRPVSFARQLGCRVTLTWFNRRRTFVRHMLLMILLLAAALTTSELQAATFPVTNTNDSGPGSLRQAILDANAAGAGPHSIVFNVYGQITILTSLPQITVSDLTIDGQDKITINSNGINFICNPFDINANNVTIRNFTLTNNGDINFIIRNNTSGVLIENISTASTTGNFLNAIVFVQGASTGLTLRNITSSDVEVCGGNYPHYLGRAFMFTGGMQTNLVMDSIFLRSLNNTRACEAIVFRDASVNGWTFTNSDISGFQNGVVMDHITGGVETANNILLNNITVDSMHGGTGLCFYSDFVNTNITIKNCSFNQDVPGTTNDGDYNIRFDNSTDGIILDSLTVRGSDLYTVWFNGPTTNIEIKHSTFDCAEGEAATQLIRFEGVTSSVLMQNVIVDGDRPGNDDGDHGVLFMNNTTEIQLDSVTINEFDVDGVYTIGANTNFRVTNSTFTNNFDGIEFYNSRARTNVDITKSRFSGSGRSGIVVNAANPVSDIDITDDTIVNNVNHGIWLYGGTPATDIMISGNVISDNGGAGIFNDAPDKVIYTNNSIYNNTGAGIDNVTGNCGYQNPGSVPTLVSSSPLGGGQYELVINLPAIAATGYTVDIYANDPATSATSGQYFVTSIPDLTSGNNTVTVTYNTGPGATGAGFWTATLRIPANNCGTSEFSNKLAISPQGPGNVDANVKLWLRADAGLTNNATNSATEGQVVNRWSDFSQGGAPVGATSTGTVTYRKAGINFNPAGHFSGSVIRGAMADGSAWLNSANVTSFAVFNKHSTSANGSRVYVVYDNASGGYDYNTNAGSIIFGRTGNNIQTHRANQWENPPVVNAIGKAGLFTSVTTASAHAMYYNGLSQGAAAYNKGNLHAEQWFVGGGHAAGWCCGTIADIAEVITFDRELTAGELQRVHSYLAIKYGITLPGNYVASDGITLLWDATANAGYLNRITGIGRDDNTFLYQKQSLNADSGIITMALGDTVVADNASNASTINTDKSFLVFGDNGAAITYTTPVTGTYANQRMARVWKVQKTNWTDQQITLRIKGAGSRNYLLISTDPAFSSISQELPLNGSGTITMPSSMLADGIYFTIAANVKGPGCISTGIGLWLRADDTGASGAVWGDFSGNGNGAVQPNSISQPAVLPAAVNFNPALKFDGLNDFLTAPSLFTANGINNIQVYAVAVTDNVQNQTLFGELAANGYNVNGYTPWGNGILYWDAPYSYRAQGAWGGRLGAPFLWSFLRTPSAMNAYRNSTQVAAYNAAMSNIAGANSPFGVGAFSDGAWPFNGRIAELIVYNNSSAITAAQRQQIESYLAFKYGLTLNPLSPDSYLASDGVTTMWDAGANAGFNRHITGIGRDSCTGLYQKQSLSADTGFVTIALGNNIAAGNAANTGSITNDLSFFVFGDDGGAKAFGTPVTGLAGISHRLTRVFKVQKTNWTDQDITLQADTSGTYVARPEYLIISTDAAFGAGDVVLPLTNGQVTLNTSQLANASHFTFGIMIKGPGAVNTGILGWYRGDYGFTPGSPWKEFCGHNKTSSAPAGSITAGTMNFHQAPNFNPTALYSLPFNMNPNAATGGFPTLTVFAVINADAPGGSIVGNDDGAGDDRNLYMDGVLPAGPGTGTLNVTGINKIGSAVWQQGVAAGTQTFTNGRLVGSTTSSANLNGPATTWLGRGWNGGRPYDGRIAEFVMYSTNLSAADRNKVESYLALKYGITLDQTTPVDYTASDGTKMWVAGDNTGFGRRITGVGRDDADSLYQKQSLSTDTGIVTIAVGSSIAASNWENAGTIANDRSFFVFSDNGASRLFVTPVTGITEVSMRMDRVWKADKTNWADQDITFLLNGGNDQTFLLVSTDETFDAGDALFVLDAAGTVTLNSINLPDGAFFTFATTIKGPNAIVKGINFWLRADDGISAGSNWHDYSAMQNNAAQALVANQPVTDAKAINFNYGLLFDGANDFMDINTTRIHPDSATILVVASGSGYNGFRNLVSSGAVGGTAGMEFRVTNTANLQYGEGGPFTAVTATTTLLQDRPYIFGVTQNNLTNGTELYRNMEMDGQGTITFSPATANLVSVGSRTIGARAFYWMGNISEVIAYNRVLTESELQSVSSYLGLKYGITLNNGATDYVASDGTVYWTADAIYGNRITGIGRDDSTALNTKQSLSVDTGLVTLSLGSSVPLTNELNTGVVTNDKSFFVFADNGLTASNFTEQVSGSSNVTRRMARVWKVQKTNWSDQDITLKTEPVGIDNYLLISSDPDFAAISQELPLNPDGTITLSTALFTGTDIYFTFGAPLKSPGGVPGHGLWVRADIGTSSTTDNTAIELWTDMSAMSNSPKQATAAEQPMFLNNAAANINFNASVGFDGTADRMTANSVWGTDQIRNLAVFSVAAAGALDQNTLFSEFTSSNNYIQAFIPWTDGVVYWDAPYGERVSVAWGGTYGKPDLWTFVRSNPGTNAHVTFSMNHQIMASNTVANASWPIYNGTNAPFYIGGRSDGAHFNGKIAELIVYNADSLTPGRRLKIESYLGIKYGITLDQTSPVNYLATDSTVIWDAAANATYKNNIAGIGRDDEEALQQKQSRSINPDLQVTIGLGSIDSTNAANANVFGTDLSYLVWGDDGGAETFTAAVSAHPVVNYRIARVWKVQETGTVGAVVVAIPYNALPNSADAHLIVSADAGFDGSDIFYPLTQIITINGIKHYATAVDFTTGQYFSFGTDVKAPGGVPGTSLWLRPDYGTSSATDSAAINVWTDFASEVNNANQAVAANQPLFRNNTTRNINFNPVVSFNGTNQFMDLDITRLPLGTAARTVIGVGNPTSIGGTNRYILSWGQSTAGQGTALGSFTNGAGAFVGYANDLATAVNFWQPGRPNQLMGTWEGAGGNAAIYSKALPASGPVVKNWNTQGTVARIGNSSFAATQPEYWNGSVGDIIVYPFALNEGQRLKVETYLALKYGYTIDQTVANNYLATDSSVIWDATANSAYKNNIAGIGRDDEEAFVQKQSRSINTGLQVTIGLGSIDSTNMANTNDFAADLSYLIWGDDGAAATFVTPVTGQPGINYRMTRIWKVQETGTAGTVQIAIPATTIPSSFSTPTLIVSDDANFDAADTFIPLTLTAVGTTEYYAANTDLTNGQYFSFAALVTAPGGVLGSSLWVKADLGVQMNANNEVEQWFDQSGSNNTVTELRAADFAHTDPIEASAEIVHIANGINFNPAIDFSGAINKSLKGNGLADWNTTATTIFGVGKVEGTMGGGFGSLFDGLADWTINNTTSAGVGISVSNTAYSLDGSGCSPISVLMSTDLPRAVRGIYTMPGNGLNSLLAINGKHAATVGVSCGNSAASFFEVGGRTAGTVGFDNRIFNGKIPEVVVYRSQLSSADINRVESYFGIKYGLTLDQTTPANYVASDPSVIFWDAAANGAYKYNIGGIGRDDASALVQKQSRSVNPGVQIAIGLGILDSTNLANTGIFADDKSFLMWADDSAAVAFKTPITANTSVNYRMTRVWKVQETGTVGEVEVAVPYEALPNPTQSYLVISDDEIFDNSDTYIPLYDITLNSKRHWAAKADFTTGQYFTVAAFIKSPGGAGATSLWVRADHGIENNTDGSSVDVWVDFGNEVNNASQSDPAIQPVYRNNVTDNINYNPVVTFNGTSQQMTLDVTKLPAGTTARTIIGVAKPEDVAQARYIVNWGASAITQGSGLALNNPGVGFLVGFNDDVFTAANFYQVGVLNELSGTWAGAGGQANLYSKMLSVAAPVNKSWNTGTSAARLGNSYFGDDYWSGSITEVIVFDRVLTSNERQRVSTYLAIRNGYTIDQTVPTNYLNTNSSVIWDATANSLYRYNIAGIGRDDVEGLNQKQAKSVQPGALVAIGLGSIATDNSANANNFSNDTAYFLWGSNGTVLTLANTDLPGRFSSRLTQEWKVNLSNFNNQLSPIALEFDLNGIAHSGTEAAHFTLLIDTDGDGDFTTGTITEITASDYTGDKATFNNITALTDEAVFTLAIGPKSLQLITKVILQGAWNGSAMRTDLQTADVLPATDPYGQGTTPSVSPNEAPAPVVDWVLVELRDNANPTTVIDTRAALLLANGEVVDTNYTDPVRFYVASGTSYNVVIRHRNHLGVMSLGAVDFTTGVGTIDFTANTTSTFGTHAQTDLGSGVMGLWAGNVNGDNSVRNSARPSDATPIANAVITYSGNTTHDPSHAGITGVYNIHDVNLDGRVHYKASPSDHSIIVSNVATHPGNVFGLASYIIRGQVP